MQDPDSLDRPELIRLIRELRRQNEQLRKPIEELRRKEHRSAAPFSKGKRKENPKAPGRKPGEGDFRRRSKPAANSSNPPVDVPVRQTKCAFCGGRLEAEGVEEVSVTDIPAPPQPVVSLFQVHWSRCQQCGRAVRGRHPEVAADQYGATAHRVGPRVKAAAHSLHYGHGVPVRRLPAILREMTGMEVTPSAITQDALKQAAGPVGAAYRELRERVRLAPVVYSDDTGWRIGGEGAYLMAFDTDHHTVYQIRTHQGNDQVRELVPADYRGTLVTDRGSSYEAAELSAVEQPKCWSHLIRHVTEVVENKTGRAPACGLRLKGLLPQANQLWRDQQEGKARDYLAQVERIDQELTDHLRMRRLRDRDNQRLLDGIGLQHDRGRILTFLYKPEVEPTNNRAERALRPAVIARKVSHCSQNERGAKAFAAFTSVVRTAVKQGGATASHTLQRLIQPALTDST